MSKTAYYQENVSFLALSTDKIYGVFLRENKLYWYEKIMNRQKIGSNMHSTLSIIKHNIYNESVSLISPFILCALCYGCKLLFGVVICRDFFEVCLLHSAGKKNSFVFKGKRKWKDQGRNSKRRLVF